MTTSIIQLGCVSTGTHIHEINVIFEYHDVTQRLWKHGQELAHRCVPELPKSCPRVAHSFLELPKLALLRVTKTFPNLLHHFGHFRIIKK